MKENLQCVLVTHKAAKKRQGDAYGTSGIFLSDGWILSHGTLLSLPFDDSSDRDLQSFLIDIQEKHDRDLLVVPRDLSQTLKLQLQYNRLSNNTDEKSRVMEKVIIEDKNCSLRIIWRCSLLHQTFNSLNSWSFEKVDKFDKSLLSIFLLLKVESGTEIRADDIAEGKKVLSDFYKRHLTDSRIPLRRGMLVEMEATPFGNATFLDSVSRGIVSNVFGAEDCVILTDANALPGCEGAPLFTFRHPDREVERQICGIVIAPLSWCRGEWVDYTFAANLRPCLEEVLRVSDMSVALPSFGSYINDDDDQGLEEQLLPVSLDKSLVIVKRDFGWGTGIVVDVSTGTILTCSHVVPLPLGSRVKVGLFEDEQRKKGEKMKAEKAWAWTRLVYRTCNNQPYDVAVLRLESQRNDLRPLSLAPKIPSKGTRVMTLGFPFFGAAIPASCSRGVISHHSSCMIQTTCCVQGGASGGPVINCDTGEMIGLIVSNVVSTTESGALYPRFNMAVPSTVIREPLIRYIYTGDVKCLDSLSSGDPMVWETWNFNLTPRSKM
ncbi:PREDICTED: peroxisomal leader peptide-processing protease [Ceratosolen solmsi marchali]|uniref:Peroxisomal leader peptide-processing protease n=1 Tax=Ceratosolen solmsi marchali TaxID=326594 RepID=A0AAJ7E1X7_9HYME|nr:PREDICTED: peroxisomal leader peptide-processing protease [Ceratosolen solmsi marchali]